MQLLAPIVVVRYLAPTNTRGSRLKAFCPQRPDWKSVTVPFRYELNETERAADAANAFIKENPFALREAVPGDVNYFSPTDWLVVID